MNLEEAFSPRTLSKTVELHATHAMKTQVLTGMFREDSSDVSGEVVEWDEVTFPRRLAPVVDGDAPSKRIKTLKKTKRSTSICHIKLNKFLEGRKLFITENAPGELKPNASAVIGRELRDMVNSVMKTKEYLCAKAFTGSIAVSSANIEDSDLTFTVTYAVSTFTRGAAWSTAGTKILSGAAELPLLKSTYSTDTGEELKSAMFSVDVESALLGNTEIQQWVQGTVQGVTIMEIGYIQKMGGLTWTKYDGNYLPTGGSATRFIASGYGIFLPDPSVYSEYLMMAVGRGLIPNSAIGASAEGLISEAAPGFYQYATIKDDPVGVKIIVGWAGFPIIKYPNIVVYGSLI